MILDRLEYFEQIKISYEFNFYARNKLQYVFPFKNKIFIHKSEILFISNFHSVEKSRIIFTKDQINKYNASPQVMPIPNT